MTDHRVDHGTLRIERTYAASPQQVFAAWASQQEKNRWFGEGDDFLTQTDEYTLDFRVGGDERLAGTLPSGRHFSYDASYLDIVDTHSNCLCLLGERRWRADLRFADDRRDQRRRQRNAVGAHRTGCVLGRARLQ